MGKKGECTKLHTSCTEHKEQGTNFKTEIDTSTNIMVVQMDKHLQEVLASLDKHQHELESLKKYLIEERKDCSKVLHDGSEILKFDVGNAVTDKEKKTRVPDHPNIPDLQHTKCDNSAALIKKALGTLKELNHPGKSASTTAHPSTKGPQANTPRLNLPVPVPTTPEHKAPHRYLTVSTQSTWSNEDPIYYQVTPITNDTAWAGIYGYNKDKQKWCVTNNNLQLLTIKGKPLHKIQTERNFKSLSHHPTTGLLYGGFYADKTVCSIDTESGKTTVTVQCDIDPGRIKVTKDDDVLVGTKEGKYTAYRYRLTGELVHTSPEKYTVHDIDQCTRTNKVMLSCDDDGVVILNQSLTKIHTFTGLTGQTRKKFECITAIFDSYGNLIVGDWHNKEIYILDGDQYNLIQNLPIDDMSRPYKMKLNSNILWVECKYPMKVMCIDLS